MRVLDDPLAHLEGQVQPAKGGIALLEVLHDAQRVQVVIEEGSVRLHGRIQRLLAGVAEGRMSDVVHQRQRLHQVHLQPQLGGDGARDLRHLDGVRQPVAEVVGVAAGEHLGLIFQPAEGARVHHAITVALVVAAVRMRRFRMPPPASFLHPCGVRGKHGTSFQFPVASFKLSLVVRAQCFLFP